MTRADFRDRVKRYHKLLNRFILWSTFSVAGLFAMAGIVGVRRNDTPSVPKGLYLATHNPQAPYITFCLDSPLGPESFARGYRTYGSCPDGGEPLLKDKIGKPGDRITLSEKGIALNGKLLPNTAPLRRDRHGRVMSIYPFGTYLVVPGQVWSASTYNPFSFDSRYFGPIHASQIRDHLRPLWTW